ncbi:MAG: RNA methyltransferase [Clostridia bacterium]|nr:RNA methyltransferase [Clostridia bacterium]
MVITSKSNPKVKAIASLKERKFRKEYKEYLVEGVKMVTECIAAGKHVTQLICTEEYAGSFPQALVVSDEVFGYISDEKTPQGVCASVKIPDLSPRRPKGNCILLDGLQDPGNVGTVIRTANAAGFGEVYLIGGADPFSPKAVRASMSGIFFADVMCGNAEEVLGVLEGIPKICADMGGQNAFSFEKPDKFCLCIGSEGNGISQTVKRNCEYTVAIPMQPTCESLNAAVSAGILMYLMGADKR